MLPHYVASGTTDRRDSGVGPLGGEGAHAAPGSGCQTRVGRTGSEFRGSRVTAASSGETVEVLAEETLLAALRRAGVTAPYSCQQGFCGTCRIRVLAGSVDHRDTLLTDPERAAGMMLTCVSRAAEGSGLTLDL